MRLHAADRRLVRELCGVLPKDDCPVVLVMGGDGITIQYVPGHHVDDDGAWIYTHDRECYGCLGGYRYVPADRVIQVSRGWLRRRREGIWGYGKGETE